MTGSVRWPGGDRLERDRLDPRRQDAERLGPPGQADEIEQGHPGHDAVARVQGVGDRLGAVRCGRPVHVALPVVSVREHAAQELASDPGALVCGQDEEHREVPQPLAHHGGREGDDSSLGAVGRDDEALGVGRPEVGEEAEQWPGLGRDLVLAQRPDVVVDGGPPDLGAGRELRRGRPDGRPATRRRTVSRPPPDRDRSRRRRPPRRSRARARPA